MPTISNSHRLNGAGLGLRRSMLSEIEEAGGPPAPIAFWEVAPENWVGVGGPSARRFRAATERLPLVCHGLCLNLGGPAPLDEEYLLRLKPFLDEHEVVYYGDHLSYCGDNGHLYDLMPIPFTGEAVNYVAARIRRTQEILERPITVENPSYYCAPGQEMSEIDFINAVLEAADCLFLIDVNNIYVNSVNHGYDAYEFMRRLPGRRIAYAHIAGHHREADDLIVDTHGADVIDPVWDLLEAAYQHHGLFPTMIERDFNIPPLKELVGEVGHLDGLQSKWRAPQKLARA